MNDYVNNLEELASQLHDIARKLRAAGRNDLILSALGSSMLDELKAEAASDNIVISMSMYGGWEQVGFLGHSYTTDDRQMTAVNGDIVLYSGNQIVVFYGSNFWSYTKLGKMNLSVDEVTELLSKGDITLTITRK